MVRFPGSLDDVAIWDGHEFGEINALITSSPSTGWVATTRQMFAIVRWHI